MIRMLQSLTITCIALILSGCGAQCPEGTISYLTDLSTVLVSPDDSPRFGPKTLEVRTLFGRKSVEFDEVIRGVICEDQWSGTVYVTCEIEIPAWKENPFFLQDCPISIDPNTTVYVEAHRDKSYHDGCSCHE
jgi:hypothetical protein